MSKPDPIDLETLKAAASWFGQRRTGALGRIDEAAFRVWLDADAVHLRAYREVERSWQALDSIADDPAIAGLQETDRRFLEERPRRHGLAAGIAALAVLGSGWTAYETGLPASLGLGSPRAIQSFTNDVGQRSNVVLADGSTVTLDTDSEVRVLAMGATRTLELVRGRAFFVVAKDAAHPFLVRAAGRVVRATGTEFSVGITKRDVAVTLVEGSVNVSEPAGLFQPARMMRLRAGTKLAADDTDWKVSQFNPAQETSWLTGQLVFVQTPLADAIREVNRYSKRTLAFENDAVPDRQIFGMFHAGNVDQLARAIELEGFGRVAREDRDTIVMTQ